MHGGRFAVKLAREDANVASRIKADLAVSQRVLVDTIEAAKRNGDLHRDAPSADLAYMLVPLVRGIDAITQAGVGLGDVEAVADHAFATCRAPPRGRRRGAKTLPA